MIGQNLINISDCFENHGADNFKIISLGSDDFHLKTKEAIYVLSQNSELSRKRVFLFDQFVHFV